MEYSIEYNRTKKVLSFFTTIIHTFSVTANEKKGKNKICKSKYSTKSGKTLEATCPRSWDRTALLISNSQGHTKEGKGY